MPPTKQISNAALRKAERQRTAAAKVTKKALDTAFREITRQQLRDACKRPPDDFQAWGHTRTMAWLKLAQAGNRLVKCQRPKAERMADVLRQLSGVPSASLVDCQQIISPPKPTKIN